MYSNRSFHRKELDLLYYVFSWISPQTGRLLGKPASVYSRPSLELAKGHQIGKHHDLPYYSVWFCKGGSSQPYCSGRHMCLTTWLLVNSIISWSLASMTHHTASTQVNKLCALCVASVQLGIKATRHTLCSWLKFLSVYKEERLCVCLSHSSLPEVAQGRPEPGQDWICLVGWDQT